MLRLNLALLTLQEADLVQKEFKNYASFEKKLILLQRERIVASFPGGIKFSLAALLAATGKTLPQLKKMFNNNGYSETFYALPVFHYVLSKAGASPPLLRSVAQTATTPKPLPLQSMGRNPARVLRAAPRPFLMTPRHSVMLDAVFAAADSVATAATAATAAPAATAAAATNAAAAADNHRNHRGRRHRRR